VGAVFDFLQDGRKMVLINLVKTAGQAQGAGEFQTVRELEGNVVLQGWPVPSLPLASRPKALATSQPAFIARAFSGMAQAAFDYLSQIALPTVFE
jgi:hypothetical protein